MEQPRLPTRRSVTVNARELVRSHKPADCLPLVIEPGPQSVDVFAWTSANRAFLERELLTHGALLFRGFDLKDAAQLERFIQAVSDAPLEYTERSSPRHQVRGNIYTSTDYPSDQPIFFHNENSYQLTWPMKLFFFCETPATRGGATLLAANRNIIDKISGPVRQRFERSGVLYVRNYAERLGLPWQQAFQTEQKADVESYCRSHNIGFEWRGDGRLRTKHRGPAFVLHPRTGEALWFNHGAFFHVTTLPALVQEKLRSELAEEDLPQNTYYGDGSPIEPSVMQEVRDAYSASGWALEWRPADLLVLDNMLVAHAREPFWGTRKVLVGMSELYGDARV